MGQRFTLEYLQESFYLDEVNFTLYWKERPRHHFKAIRTWSLFKTRFAGKPAGFVSKVDELEYLTIKLDGRKVLAHRVVWALFYGELPSYDIDHKDGCGINNRIDNLRLCNDPENFTNARNRRIAKNNTSGRTGVYWRKERDRWIAVGDIKIDGKCKRKLLGSFKSFPEAVSARELWDLENGFTFRG